MNLLAIPNDPTKAYFRCTENEFLGEFNPVDIKKSERFFDSVSFLSPRDKEGAEIYGVRSVPLLKDKSEFNMLLKKGRENGFEYPMFDTIYRKEREEIISKIKSYNPDVIRTFNPHAMAELGIIVSEELGTPLIVSAYDPTTLTGAVGRADLVTCETQEVRSRCIDEFGVDPSRIRIGYNGIEEDIFYKRDEKEISKMVESDFLGRKNIILSCSRVVEGKNLEGILGALSLVKSNFDDILHLHLGSEPDEKKKKELLDLRNNLGLENNSFFLGPKSKQALPMYYSFADVYVLPSFWEGMNRTVRESLFCGTPVVTTNYGSMTEFVKEGYNGVLVDPYNSEDIARGFEKVLGDDMLRDNLSKNARKSVLYQHGLERTMSDAVSVYKDVLKL